MIRVGADPEFFLFNGDTPISAHDIVPGTKEEPFPLYLGAVQADGTAVEFNIDPAETEEEFSDNISTVLGQIRSFIPKKYEFKFIPDVVFDKKYFNNLPDYVKAIGCDPDFSYLGLRQLPKDTAPTRCGGGHIHISWETASNTGRHFEDCKKLTMGLNYGYSLIDTWSNTDSLRQKLFIHGNFRPKQYGIEFRVPSNEWLNESKNWSMMFRLSRSTVEKWLEYDCHILTECDVKEILRACDGR